AVVAGVMVAVGREWPGAPRIVLAGFSQGVAMMFRAAAAAAKPVDGVVAVGGDVPPELERAALARVRAALVCRSMRDEWYTSATFDNDVGRLGDAGSDVQPRLFES